MIWREYEHSFRQNYQVIMIIWAVRRARRVSVKTNLHSYLHHPSQISHVASFSGHWASFILKVAYSLMKTQMEDVEDDLAAEEENKLINEVCTRVVILWLSPIIPRRF